MDSISSGRAFLLAVKGPDGRKRITKLIFRIFQITMSLGLVFYLATFIDWDSVRGLARSGLLVHLWLSSLILVIGLFFAAMRWRLLLDSFGIFITHLRALCLYLVGNFYSVLLPGVIGGDAVRMGLCIVSTRGTASKVFASLMVERVLGMWGLALLGTISLISLGDGFRETFGLQAVLISPVLALAVPLAVVLLFGSFKISEWLVARAWRPGNKFRLLAEMASLVLSIPPRNVLITLVLSTAFQFSEILVFYYFGTILDLGLPLVLYLAVVPIVYFATIVPISLGGIGVRESVLVWLLTKVGVVASDAVLLGFMVYLNRIVVSLIGGGIQWSRVLKHPE